MSEKTIRVIAKIIIWVGLAVIIFSPLYLNSKVFFPFIVTKTIAFNIAVEVMFLAFLILSLIRQRSSDGTAKEGYRFRINLAVVLLGLYIIWSFISSLTGDNFYRSFWSSNERSEGLLLFVHLFLFFIVVSSFFRRLRDWLYIFDLTFFASLLVSLVAFGQFIKLPWLFASSGGERLAGTLGNAGYMAGYLVFAVLIGLFLLFRRKNIYLRFYYGAVIALEVFIVVNTFTRGGWVAIFVALFLFLLYLCFLYWQKRWLKIVGVVIIILAIVTPIFLVVNKQATWIQESAPLKHFTNIFNFKESSASNRLMTWQTAAQGFKERPVFGWGLENFYQPFDKYYNPQIFRHGGSVVWFDRAHNVFFDRLLVGGIPGVLLYLSFLLAPFYFLWRHYKKKQSSDNEAQVSAGRKYFIPTILSLIVLAYFIQNWFIFEALVTYVPLFLILAFVGFFSPNYNWRFLRARGFKMGLLIIYIIAFVPVLYFANIKPLNANLDITMAINNPMLTVEQRINLFEDVLSRKTLGNQEYRRQLFFAMEQVVQNSQIDDQIKDGFVNLTREELQKQLEENPHSVANHLLVMRFNNSVFSITGDFEYVNKNKNLFDKAMELSPNRQQVHFEIGYTYLTLANHFKASGQDDMAEANYDLAMDAFRHAVNLNNQNFESYRQLANVIILAERTEAMVDLVAELEEVKPDGHIGGRFLSNVMVTAVGAKNYEMVKFAAMGLIEIDPQDINNYVQLAMAHASLGEDEEAIALAEEIAKVSDDAKKQSEEFIRKVRAGEFR